MDSQFARLRSLPYVTLLIALVISAIVFLPAEIKTSLLFNRYDILGGEWYRLFTCHFVHLDNQHAFLNLFALLVMGCMYETGKATHRRTDMLVVIVLSAILISIWVLWIDTSVVQYVGFSGVLYAMGILWGFDVYRVTGQKWLFIIPVFFLGRTILQWDLPVYAGPGLHVYYPAHLIGLATGIFYVFFYSCTKNYFAINSKLNNGNIIRGY